MNTETHRLSTTINSLLRDLVGTANHRSPCYRVFAQRCEDYYRNPSGHQRTLKNAWHAALRRAKVPYFRIYDLRSTYATRLSAGGVADEWVTQMLRQGDAQVFKKYSQMKLRMKREALEELNRRANEMPAEKAGDQIGTVSVQ
jgi:integrase